MPTVSEATALEQLIHRVETTLSETGDAFPYFADPDSAEWRLTDDGNWCGGHWIGMLWLAYDITGDERYATAAENHWATVREHLPSDTMFYGMNHQYAGFRAYDITGSERHRAIGLQGAEGMSRFYHELAQQLPLGELAIASPASNFRGPKSENGPSGATLGAVDALYVGATVLWRAAREANELRYRDIAQTHADRHLDWYIREDGSTWHHAEFDETGELVRQYNELAYSDETCWARGQGWNIAGLARSYRETGHRHYLDALRKTVDYYVSNTPDDLVPHWDFEHPDKPNVPRDTSAAALTAYGLVQLSEDDVPSLVDIGERILSSLLSDYLTPRKGVTDDRPVGRVLESCFNGPAGFAARHEHVWTNYYLMYTLYHRQRNSTSKR